MEGPSNIAAPAAPDDLTRRIRRARGRFAAMAATYALGVLNDNFFKQAAMLLAFFSAALTKEQGKSIMGIAAVVSTVPWLLFAAPAGWLADRYSKRKVVIGAKVLELVAMLIGAAGILLGDWWLILVMLFLMNLQSTVFSPALNGSIPDLYPASYVLKANSIVKMITTSAILIGIIVAGVCLGEEVSAAGRWRVAVGVVAVAAVGVAVSFGVPKRSAAAPRVRFPWLGPLDTLRSLYGIFRTDRLLGIVIVTDMYVWFVAVLQILVINTLGEELFGFGPIRTTWLVTAELAGVAIGGALAGKFATGGRWHRVLAPGMAVLACAAGAMAVLPVLPAFARLWAFCGLLLVAGTAGGLLLVPLEAFFQIRPSPDRRGAVIAAANFAGFAAMAVAGGVSSPWNLHIGPTWRFPAIGALTLPAAGLLWWALRKEGRT